MTRTGPKNTLSKSPLVLVLSQVRFSPLMAMSSYIAAIQDRLRQSGYPLNSSVEVQEFPIAQPGARSTVRPHWEFLSKDQTTSVIVNEGFVVVQTTTYDDFDAFLARTLDAVEIVATAVGGLLIQRVGLRYVDLIRPNPGETWEKYVSAGLRGFASPHLAADTAVRVHQTIAKTEDGMMIARLLQNREGSVLPPDLVTQTLQFPKIAPVQPSELLTIIDIDHYREVGLDEFDRGSLKQTGWKLKNASYDVFVAMVTREALETWR